MSQPSKELYEFSRFRLDVSERLLWRDGKHVSLPDKAFVTLIVLPDKIPLLKDCGANRKLVLCGCAEDCPAITTEILSPAVTN